jgi:hypothetical protein
MLPQSVKVEGINILSITKPVAKEDKPCAWCGKLMPKGRIHVRCVWKDRRQDKANPVVNSDRICVDCWTK